MNTPRAADFAAPIVEDVRNSKSFELHSHGDSGRARSYDRDFKAFRNRSGVFRALVLKRERREREKFPSDLEMLISCRNA